MRWPVTFLLLLVFSLTCFASRSQEVLLLNWQPGQLNNNQQVLKTTFTVTFPHTPSQGDQIKELTDLSAKPLHITARPGQVLTVCGDRVTGYSTGDAIEPDLSLDGKPSKIMLADWHTTLDIESPLPCPDYESTSQPYHFMNVLRSDESFMVVLGEHSTKQRSEKRRSEKRRSEKRQESSSLDSDKQTPPVTSSPFTLPESVNLLSGSGYGSDSGDDPFSKRPPHLPFMGKRDLSLTLLPFIRLPSEWQTFLPVSSWYHWLVGEPDAEAGVTVIIRLNRSAPVFLHLSPWEYRELAENMQNTHQLVQWLAYKLSGRESFVQALMDMMFLINEQEVTDETLSEKFEEQLMVVLEQPDMEFSLEFETHLLTETLSGVSLASLESGIIHLPEGNPDDKPGLPAGQGAKPSSEKEKASEDLPEQMPDQKPGTHGEDNKPPPEPTGSGQASDAGERVSENYFAIMVGGKEFHIKKEQLPPLNRGQEKAANIKAYNPANPSDSLKLNEVEAATGEGVTLQEQLSIREAHNKALRETARKNADLPTDRKLPVPSFPDTGRLRLSGSENDRVLNYLLTYGSSATKNTLQHYYPVNRIYESDEHLTAEIDHRGYPVDETCQICQGLLLSQHSLTTCTQASQHVFHTGCLAQAFQTTPPDIDIRIGQRALRQNSCPACRSKQTPELSQLLTKEGLVSELHRAARAGDSAIIKALLEAHVNVEARDEQGNTALHLAAQAGHSDIVLLLTDFGADFEAENRAGQLPVATATDYPDIIDILKQAQQSPSIFFTVGHGREEALRQWLDEGNNLEEKRPLDGASLLHLAAVNNHLGIAKQLLESASKYNIDLTNKLDNRKTPPLSIASGTGSMTIAELLLNNGARVGQVDDDGETPLLMAASQGHALIVKLLLDRGAPVNNVDSQGFTALSYAVFRGHVKIVQLLLDNGAEDIGDDPVLLHTAVNGYAEIMELLLEHGVQVDRANTEGETPLLFAAHLGHINLVRMLLDKGAQADKANKTGEAPLLVAIASGHTEIAQLLINFGAQVNQASADGSTPLLFAAYEGHISMVQLLLNHGAQVNQAAMNDSTPLSNAVINGHVKVVELLLKNGAHFDQIAKNGATLLLLAAQHGHTEVVQLLLQHGILADQARDDSATPLLLASSYGYTKVAQLLLDHGAQVDKLSADGSTALHLAARKGHIDIVQLLLDHEAQVNQAAMNDSTPLSIAVISGHTKVVELLLKHGAHFDQIAKNGATLLLLAAQHGHTEVVRLLLQRGILADQARNDSATPLMLASSYGYTDVAQLLLDHGAQVDKLSADGSTALHLAAREGHIDIVQLLLDHGAKVSHITKDGTTPLIFAAQSGYTEVVQLLLSLEAPVNQASYKGATPLFVASLQGHTSVVQSLLSHHEIQVDQATPDGATPLQCATKNGRTDIVELLLKRGAQVNQVSKGSTPLIISALHGNFDMAVLLIKYGAQVNKGVSGFTPLNVAQHVGHNEIVSLFKDNGAQASVSRTRGSQVTSVQPGYHETRTITSTEQTPLLMGTTQTHQSSSSKSFLSSCCGGNPED